MKTDVLQRIDSILQLLEETARDAKAFTTRETPGLVKELLKWAVVRGILTILVGVFIAVCIFLGQYVYVQLSLYPHHSDSYFEAYPEFPIAQIGLSSLLYLLPIFMIASSIEDILQSVVAPKVWLLDYTISKLSEIHDNAKS
jgi:uncharacterized membrane protein HdeD (DUF308 family)